MDMNVNTRAFYNAANGLEAHAEMIGVMTDLLMYKIRNAQNDFDDVNYERTLRSVMALKQAIDNFSYQIGLTKRDLMTLEHIVNQYVSGGYKGNDY